MSTMISYPEFVRAGKCLRRYWLKLHGEQVAELADIACYYQRQYQQLLDLYIERFDDSVQADSDESWQASELKAMEPVVLISASVNATQYRAQVDVLKKDTAGRWSFVIVKAASGIKDRYLTEAAFQLYVLSLAGLEVCDCRIVCVNKQYVKGAGASPFIEHRVFKQARQRQEAVVKLLQEMVAIEGRHSYPEACLQRNCVKPALCPYYDKCWPGLSEYNILTIPYLSPAERESLTQRGLVEVDDLADEEGLVGSLKTQSRQYVQLVKNKTQLIDVEAIALSMKSLEYPLYFLDFEADNPALPKIPGQKAFMKIPFQFSCHCLGEDGALSHYDYLHRDEDDPRPALITKLLANMSDQGSVIVWHADFEHSRLRELAVLMPQYAEKLLAIAARLWDMEPIFQHYYLDYRFKGSCSVKAVIKALLPKLSYDDLLIKDGEQVVAVWNLMLAEKELSRRKNTFDSIRAYCERDTLAMVELFRYLQSELFTPGQH